MKKTRRKVLTEIAAGALATVLASPARVIADSIDSQRPRPELKDVNRIVDNSMVVDDLAGFMPKECDVEGSFAMVRKSGVTIVSPTIGSVEAEESYESSLRELSKLSAVVNRYSNRMLLVRRFADIGIAHAESKVGILPNLQNTTAIGTDLSRLDFFYGLGIRQIQLTHNWRNWVGDGCTERTQAGLSYFGVDLIKKMNQLGIVVDVAHSGYQTTMDAIEVSDRPIVFSHANCMALCEHPRNKSDVEIKALADKGGVMGISTFNWFVSHKPQSGLEDLLDHFDYLINLVGPDHVGIGTDFSLPGYLGVENDDLWRKHLRIYSPREQATLRVRWPPFIEELNNEQRYKTIAKGLFARGHSEEVILKVLGLNFVRVFKQTLMA